MKFKDERPLATPEAAERKLLEIANAIEADHAGLTSLSMVLAAFFALALLYGYDGYFFEGYYGSATWKLFQQIGRTFAF